MERQKRFGQNARNVKPCTHHNRSSSAFSRRYYVFCSQCSEQQFRDSSRYALYVQRNGVFAFGTRFKSAYLITALSGLFGTVLWTVQYITLNEGLSVAVFYLNSQKSCAQFLKLQKSSLLIDERASTFSLFVFNIKSRSPSVVFLIITSFALNALAFIKQIIGFHISRFYARSVKPADILISSR